MALFLCNAIHFRVSCSNEIPPTLSGKCILLPQSQCLFIPSYLVTSADLLFTPTLSSTNQFVLGLSHILLFRPRYYNTKEPHPWLSKLGALVYTCHLPNFLIFLVFTIFKTPKIYLSILISALSNFSLFSLTKSMFLTHTSQSVLTTDLNIFSLNLVRIFLSYTMPDSSRYLKHSSFILVPIFTSHPPF